MDNTIAAEIPRARMSTDSAGRIGLRQFFFIAAQLGLLLLVLRQFKIEGAAFVELAAFAFAGFAVHAFLPMRLRLPFFGVLSLASIGMVLGPVNGLWLCAIGFLLIGICHLPVDVRVRMALLCTAGGMLMAMRAQLVPVPWSEAIWPILGGMFMFRLVIYFYDLRHDKTPPTRAQTIGYFFMLPNACFPLFPVIDFKTYRRSHYAGDAFATYQKGVDWIVRGVVHLILYRYIYYHQTLAPSEVLAPADFMQYVVSNFLLYLRVSGLFHLIVGMLHLFGFSLPETHNRYLLASSFTDFWRRINIYWKDFMQKVFYFPAIFALKRFGPTRSIILATLYVFLLTWFLHSYQWFWLRGQWLFAWHDFLFWAILGALVVANSLYEMKHGRSRSLKTTGLGWRKTAAGILKSYAVFWFICVLWSFWTAESISDWLSLWSSLNGGYTAEVLLYPAIVLAVIAMGSLPQKSPPKGAEGQRLALRKHATVSVGIVAALLLVSIESVHTRLGPEVATMAHSLRSAHLSRLDNAKLERGYYEGLMAVDRFNSQLWEVYSKKPANWLDGGHAGLKRFVGGFGQFELVPSVVLGTQYGPISTNRWGLRDQDYAEKPGPDTLRAAVLGPSTVMGWGVGDRETFEALVEERLNASPVGARYKRAELLNFGVPGYQPPQQMPAFERSLQLHPNAVFYFATGRELSRAADYLAEAVTKKLPIPYPRLQAIVNQSGVRADMDEATLKRHLQPHQAEILQAVYDHIGRGSLDRGIHPVWIFLPQVREGLWQEETGPAEQAARAAGFSVINLQDVYKGHDIATIRLAEWDDHPNRMGHELVARRLYDAIAADPALAFGASPAR
jgi:D-alanyl-lipoteichoic acid acyltransferase DltB (MBOAT superfamily)